MKLAVFNGSPRAKSNTSILLDQLIKGYEQAGGESYTLSMLKKRKDLQEHLQSFMEADTILIAFPLYVDSMPGLVKYFLEEIDQLDSHGKKLGFIVQSGFPEAKHSEYVARYLDKFTRRIGAESIGIVLRGGVEGIQIQPPSMTKKLFTSFNKLGESLALTGVLNPKLIQKLQKLYEFKLYMIPLVNLILKGAGSYWDQQLKENGALERSFDRPYA